MRILEAVNYPITICTLLLLSIGIIVLSSISWQLALQQGGVAILGFLIYFLISQFDYRSLKNFTILLYGIAIILLVIVQLVGWETRGTVRWIPLGLFNIQPSELTKPVLILLLAAFWTENLPDFKNILKSLIWFLPPLILIFRQPDLGSFLTLSAIWVGMLLATKISLGKIVILVLLAVLIIPSSFLILAEYQKQRITSFLAPGSDPLGSGYNLIQSQIAVGSGQIMGQGLGRGTQSRLQFLPEFKTDFIFAFIAEELGFIGSMLIILIYLILLIYSIKVAQESSDFFGFLIVMGSVMMLLFQTFVNIGMNVGLLPITGITLPLISYGGSSLVATLVSLGLISSVAKFKKLVDMEKVGE